MDRASESLVSPLPAHAVATATNCRWHQAIVPENGRVLAGPEVVRRPVQPGGVDSGSRRGVSSPGLGLSA
jgi:hypothetical protein